MLHLRKDLKGPNKNTTDINNKSKDEAKRKRRVQRMKKGIIIIALILLILPMIICIYLGFRVYKLQQKVDYLMSRKESILISEEAGLGSNHYAYAAGLNLTAKPEIKINKIIPGLPGTIGSNTDISDEKDNIDEITDENDKKQTEQNIDKSKKTDQNIKKNKVNMDDQTKDTADKAKKNKLKPKEYDFNGKLVYLTFDDGPSIYTDDILDILAKYKVKASFFVIGQKSAYSKRMYKRIIDEGHALGMHSYSHDYNNIYNSVKDFDKDFTKLWKLLYDTTGYKSRIYRFPGGSSNQVNQHGMDEFIRYLNEKSVIYYDWNVVSNDATGVTYTKKQLIDNVLNGIIHKKRSIVLMHDTKSKKTTIDSLPDLLETLLSSGAKLLPLDETVSPIQQIKSNSID